MKAPVLQGKRKMTYEEVPEPVAGPNEVVIEIELCGVCGSDLHLYDSEMAPSGIVLGHEYSASIVEVGEGVRGWEPGERVVATMAEPCANCWFCRRGETHLCYQHYRIDMQRAGIAQDAAALGQGGYGPLTKVPAARLMRLADHLDARQGACVEPAAVGFHAVRNSGMRAGDRVVVLGGGPIGLFTTQCARVAGAGRIVCVEPVLARQQAALASGADLVLKPADSEELAGAVTDLLGAPPDVVFDAAGVKSTLQQAVDLVKPGGFVMMVGVAFDAVPVKPSTWVTKQARVRAAFAYNREDYRATMDLMARKSIDVEPLISEVALASEVPDVFERLLAPSKDIKVLIDPRR
jgi:(R,R)-butanediol dehydrogenase/meso-butanediol dehydrogenase/diacetyl reductase